MSETAVAPHACSVPGCPTPASGHCASCGCAWYCSREHQRKAWKQWHKKWCALVRTLLPAVPECRVELTFLGQSSGSLRELSQLNVKLRAAVAPRPGWRSLPSAIQLADAAPPEDKDAFYCSLEEPVDMAAMRKQWPSEELVIPRRQCQLDLSYCLGTGPSFLLTTAAAGFTAVDLASATARCYQWCYMHEDAVTSAPSMGMLLNRGPTNGACDVGPSPSPPPPQAPS